jgi:N-acetylmuramoyl-L-alanine amidase
MSRIFEKASAVAVAVTVLATLFSANGSGAAAQSSPAAVREPIRMVSQPVVQSLPAEPDAAAATSTDSPDFTSPAPAATSLAALVSAQGQPEDMSRDLNCLAGAIYFESKGESLEGQLAVARVIIARSKSGRFPASYCGVVYQPSQFSFVRGNAMPAIRKGSLDWREAVAVAEIADANTWQSPVEGATSFHAASVSPNWRMKRVARVGNHIFYR